MAEIVQKENLLLRMQADIQRAMEKPEGERRWGMVIDLRKCVGCHACTMSCVAENKLPPGVVYRPVLDQEIGLYPNVTRRFMPRPCMQCEEPPCVPVCPVNATYKRPDGIVAIDYEQCIGCRYCITACPYSARTFDAGYTYTENTPAQQEYELLPNYEYGVEHARVPGSDESPIGNARKCHFCLHRLEQGDAADVRYDLHRRRKLLWRPERPGEPGVGNGVAAERGSAEGRTRHQTQSCLSGLGETIP